MNKIKCGLALSFSLIFSPAFSYVNNTSANKKITYCPEKVECYKHQAPGAMYSDCLVNSVETQYWKNQTVANEPGTYFFYKAMANYNGASLSGATCAYKDRATFPQDPIIFSKLGSNLEAFVDKSTKWEETGKMAECHSNTPASCTLIEKPEVIIETDLRDKNNLDFYDPRNRIFIKIAVNQIYMDFPTWPISINYYKALIACGSVKQCQFHIMVSDSKSPPSYVGSIVVDMENNMQIISVSPLNNNSPYVMQKKDPFNTIIFYKK